MKKVGILYLTVSCLNLFSFNVFADGSKVLATYKDGTVTEQNIMDQFGLLLEEQGQKTFADLNEKMRTALINEYVIGKEISKRAEEQKIDQTPSFKKKLAMLNNQLMQSELIAQYVKNKVTDQMIDDEFAEMVAKLKTKKVRKAAHILVDSEKSAKDIKQKINKGAKFADLAKEYSMDNATKNNNGELDYLLQTSVVPEFGDKLFSMKKGEVSSPVKTQFGWHIIKMIDEKPATIPTKEEVVGEIRSMLEKKLVKQYLEEIVKESDIKIN